LYVLDRLLSLQLGRPPAIHDEDCHVSLPSRLDDADIEWESEAPELSAPGQPTKGDYFLYVIRLSGIIGSVLRDQRRHSLEGGLARTASLDEQLLNWKRSLPRPLRFDFGHAFEPSIVFKRQV
jgi:hypothetical protein